MQKENKKNELFYYWLYPPDNVNPNLQNSKIRGRLKMKNFAGIKFRGWPKNFILRELNFAEDPLKREIREI